MSEHTDLLNGFLERAKTAQTDSERWAVIRDAWEEIRIDWDYDSRDLMTVLDPKEDT